MATLAEAIFADPQIDTVCLLCAADGCAGRWWRKRRPPGSTSWRPSRSQHRLRMSTPSSRRRAKVRRGVLYGRSGDGFACMARQALASGEIGTLALYRHDWLHHYPQWNTWALDPAKNGGPFMDAMIHNLNLARYLMARPMRSPPRSSPTSSRTRICPVPIPSR